MPKQYKPSGCSMSTADRKPGQEAELERCKAEALGFFELERRKARVLTSLRIPEGLRSRIVTAAEENGRSMNAEITSRLEQSYAADENA